MTITLTFEIRTSVIKHWKWWSII